MEEREEMRTDLAEANEEETYSGGMGTAVAMLIGSGLTLAAIAGASKARKAWRRHKSRKKEAGDGWPDDEEEYVDAEYEEVEEPEKEKK